MRRLCRIESETVPSKCIFSSVANLLLNSQLLGIIIWRRPEHERNDAFYRSGKLAFMFTEGIEEKLKDQQLLLSKCHGRVHLTSGKSWDEAGKQGANNECQGG